jgi:hypothetical protein
MFRRSTIAFAISIFGFAACNGGLGSPEDVATEDELPNAEQAGLSNGTLKILTYNIMWGDQTRTRLERIANYIADNQFEVVAFQEFEGGGKRPVGALSQLNRRSMESTGTAAGMRRKN